MMKSLLTASTLVTLPLSAVADDHGKTPEAEMAMIGPEVGASVPAIAATLPGGGVATLDAISGTEGVAMAFVRSADWCPFCKQQLIDLNDAVGPLGERGWNLVAVSYDSADVLSAFKTKQSIDFTLLSDEGSATIDAFGLRNTEMDGKGRFAGVPHPAIVFVSADGIVVEVLREEGYKDRPPVETVVGAADALAASGS